MDELISWTNENFEKDELHPILIIATFVYEFLSIHPYQDGNGRLSRLLTTLLLLKQDYDFMQYASMEIEIEKQKKEYYKALMNGQKNRSTKNEIIDHWILFFLDTLIATINKLENRYEKIKTQKSYLNDRQEELLRFIEANQPVKISDVVSNLTKYTQYTLKKDMRYLTDEAVVKKRGKGKSTIYFVNDEEENEENPFELK